MGLLSGSFGMVVSLGLLTFASALSLPGTVSVTAVLLYVACFSFSWGPLAWVIPAELVHSRWRARVLGAGTVLNWIADYVVVSTYLSLKTALGTSGAFALYAVVNLFALVFVAMWVPETKGLELDEQARLGLSQCGNPDVSQQF